MIGESPAVNPELSDIRRIKEIGIPTFLNEQENAEEGLYRVRRAYDSAWQHVYDAAFPENAPKAIAPAQELIDAFDKIWDLAEDPEFLQYAEFASLGNWSRQERNEIKVLFGDGAQYYFETKFTHDVASLCDKGNVTGSDTHETHSPTAKILIHFMTTTFLTWWFMPGDNISTDEAKLGTRTITLGPDPTIDG